MVPKGNYKARAVNGTATWGESKTKGTKCVGLEFEVTEGPSKGQRVPWTGYLTEATKDRTLEALVLCGCEDVTTFEGIDANEVLIVVEEETYTTNDGEVKTVSRVAWVNDPARTAFNQKPLAAGEAQAYAESLRGAFAAMKQKKAAAGTGFPHGANAGPPAAMGTAGGKAVKF